MSKKILYILICILAFAGCQTTTNPFFRTENEPQVYLFNDEALSIEPVNLYLNEVIDIENVNHVINYVLAMLSEGANSSNLKPTLKKEVQLEYFVFNQGNILLNFSEEYSKMNEYEELIARNSIVLSLTSFNMIDSVEIFIDEKMLKDTMGKRIGPMQEEDVFITMYEAANTSVTKLVTIYYPTKNQRYLKTKKITLTVNSNKHQEEGIIEYLLANTSFQILDDDVQLLDVQIQENICYVNFNEKFVASYLPEGITSSVAIYSIVNTLTELSHISKVQILIEGEVVESFQGTFSLKAPLSKNYEIIR